MATTDHTATAAPAVTITPASPSTASPSTTQTPAQPATDTVPTTNTDMTAHQNPTESETALLAGQSQPAQGQATTSHTASSAEKDAAGTSASATGRTSPLETLTRRLSGKSAPKTSTSNDVAADAVASEQKPRSTAPATTPAPAASTSQAATTTSKPAAAGTSAKAGQKKKKKRKGLAGIFVALGCLSAGEFEDETKTKAGSRDMAQRPGQSVTKTPAAPATSTTTTAAAVPAGGKAAETKPAGEVGPAQTTTAEGSDAGHRGETASSTLVDDTTKSPTHAAGVPKEAIVVAPVEPVHIPVDETAGVTSSAVQPPGSGSELLSTPHRPSATRRESDTAPSNVAGTSSSEMAQTETSGGYTDVSESDIRAADEAGGAVDEQEYGLEEEYEDEEDRLIAQGGMGIPLDENGQPAPLLPLMSKEHHGRKCLVLDLDETLLHSSFKMLPTADYIVPVEIESQTHNVYVIKRPGVDHFLTEMGKIYEVVVFTASLSKYADPVLDMLDPAGVVKHRLFRESCYNHKGNYVKDLSQLGRDMEGCIIIDNSPASYIFHPNNAVPVSTWFNDPHDTELTDLCPFLTDLATVDDIRGVLDGSI